MARVTRAQLVGAWELVRWEIVHDGGARRTLPFGEHARGLLLYTADGCMAASIMAAGRAPFSTANPRDAPLDERARAFDGYFSYSGRYRLVGGEVRHEVLVALNASQVGTLQTRNARLAGRRLELTADEVLPDARERRHVIEWRRVRRRNA
ncbi:MAG: lipocalin-like domain-containing protein [Gammaproteobacteria bacterium]